MKKIAIIHDFLVRYGGAEALVKAWSEEFKDAPIFTLFYDEKKMGKFFPKNRVRTSYLQKWYNLTKRYTWMLPMMPRAIESFDLGGYDIVLSSSGAFSHGALTSYEQKHISYVHSPMRWAWDYHFEFMKEREMGVLKRFFFERMIFRLREWDTVSALRPDIILSASSTIKDRIKKYWNRDSQLVFPFADTDKFVLPREKVTKDYFLIVSQLVPYKRIDIAIKACEALGERLIVVGDGIERKKLESLSNGKTEFLGALYGEKLVHIMQNAKAFLFTGVDDFGISPVEAMACGVPVIAYRKGGVLDTVEEGVSGLFFEEQSVESLKKTLEKKDFLSFNKENIRKVAEKFSREKHMNMIWENIRDCS